MPTALRGSFDLCAVCGWEDDGVQFDDPDVRGGANVPSLREARLNFDRSGMCDENAGAMVRPPQPEELPRASW